MGLFGQDDRGLLPAGLRLAPAAAQERRVLCDQRRGRGGRVPPVQALPAERGLAGRAPRRRGRARLRADPRARQPAEPRRAGEGGADQPLSLPPRVQADHRRDPARMGQGASARPLRRPARCRRQRRRGGLRRRLRRQLARLRGGAVRARHDPGGAAARRARRDDPLHQRARPRLAGHWSRRRRAASA